MGQGDGAVVIVLAVVVLGTKGPSFDNAAKAYPKGFFDIRFAVVRTVAEQP
jgi:hypothetical protein